MTLHPADSERIERYARTIANGGRCEHGREVRECLVCIQLEHAEKTSVAVRAAYGSGDWPPDQAPGANQDAGGIPAGPWDAEPARLSPMARRVADNKTAGRRLVEEVTYAGVRRGQ